jgi:hypothetical protein
VGTAHTEQLVPTDMSAASLHFSLIIRILAAFRHAGVLVVAECQSGCRVGVASGKYIFEQPLKHYWEEQQVRSRGETGQQPPPQQQLQPAGEQATSQQQQSQRAFGAARQAASADSGGG